MISGPSRSSIARTPPGHDPRRGLERLRDRTVRYVVHQSGAGIVDRAVKRPRPSDLTPAQAVDIAAIDYYASKRISAHYYIALDGSIWLLTHESVRVPHVGVSAEERRAYLDGHWARGRGAGRMHAISPRSVELWRESWPRYASPQHLHPTPSINDVSVGSEMAPAGYYVDGAWRPLPGVVPWLATRHTLQQHLAVALLAVDLAGRHRWPLGWHHDERGGPRTPFVLGHEDVDLYGRSDTGGGWDPGALRADPRWDWELVHGAIVGLLQGGRLARFILRALRGLGGDPVA